MVFRLIGLGKKIGFRLIGLGKCFIPISPRYAKKVQAPPGLRKNIYGNMRG